MDCHFLLQGIFPTQGLNPCLLHLLYWQVATWEAPFLCYLLLKTAWWNKYCALLNLSQIYSPVFCELLERRDGWHSVYVSIFSASYTADSWVRFNKYCIRYLFLPSVCTSLRAQWKLFDQKTLKLDHKKDSLPLTARTAQQSENRLLRPWWPQLQNSWTSRSLRDFEHSLLCRHRTTPCKSLSLAMPPKTTCTYWFVCIVLNIRLNLTALHGFQWCSVISQT